jgi:hypothetical protein
MTSDELNALGETLAALTDRCVAAELRAAKAERERDALRALLTRMRTSLAESTVLQGDV